MAKGKAKVEEKIEEEKPEGADVVKNHLGGIYISEEELKIAFDWFDIHNMGRLTVQSLQERLAPLYKKLPVREYKFLLGEGEFTFKSLKKLLIDNELTDFDPVKEAFKVWDPHNTGYVENAKLKAVFSKLGFGEVTDEDIQVLVETADADGDGKISLDDFRNMIEFNKRRQKQSDPIIDQLVDQYLDNKQGGGAPGEAGGEVAEAGGDAE